jgi:ABC-type Mn2+/Zn2+ transport system ATPase subunit
VTVRFGRHDVLRDVSLVIQETEYVCVRGANGAGKTTLLRLVAGATRPTRGRRVGPASCAYVPPALAPPAMSVTSWLRGVRRTRIGDPWRELAALGFDGEPDRSCRELSFGNLRKVLLADAFTSAAPLLAVDEAHQGLDHAGRVGLERLIGEARARGATVVIAAQDDDEVVDPERTLVVAAAAVREGGTSGPDVVRHTLRGPRTAEAELLRAAGQLGFRLDEDDDR